MELVAIVVAVSATAVAAKPPVEEVVSTELGVMASSLTISPPLSKGDELLVEVPVIQALGSTLASLVPALVGGVLPPASSTGAGEPID